MNQKGFANIIFVVVIVMLVGAVGYFAFVKKSEPPSQQPTPTPTQTQNLQSPTPSAPIAVEYRNNQYGFKFALPTSWKGYSIVTGEWEGYTPGGTQGDVTTERGPMISIRHP